jgi:hypothetical protein
MIVHEREKVSLECIPLGAKEFLRLISTWRSGASLQGELYFGFFRADSETVKEISFDTGLSFPAAS